MKVKLLISRSGPAGTQLAGDVVDVSPATARRMFEARPPQAVPAPGYSAAETRPASSPAVEPRHIGGGWYELPDGRKVQGRAAAEAALAAR